MIRVNLLRNLGSVATAQAPSSVGEPFAAESVSPEEAKRQSAIKLVAILLPPIAVYAFQFMDGAARESEIQGIRSRVAAAQQKRAAAAPAALDIESFQAKQKKLRAEVTALKSLSSARLREVKSLDAIQSSMPERTWLTRVKIEKDLVSIQGYSASEDGYSELTRKLEATFFRDVQPKSSVQEESPAGPLKKFEVECKVGRGGKQEE
jgi:Tfp pilus assembly protein PilN